ILPVRWFFGGIKGNGPLSDLPRLQSKPSRRLLTAKSAFNARAAHKVPGARDLRNSCVNWPPAIVAHLYAGSGCNHCVALGWFHLLQPPLSRRGSWGLSSACPCGPFQGGAGLERSLVRAGDALCSRAGTAPPQRRLPPIPDRFPHRTVALDG